jgi:hypothetical protein
MWNKENTLSFVLLKRKFKATLLPNNYTAIKNVEFRQEIQPSTTQDTKYLDLKQYTIPVDNSTPKKKTLWSVGKVVSTSKHLYLVFCSTLAYAWLDSRVIYRHVRKILVFKSVRKISHIVTKPYYTHGKIETDFLSFLVFFWSILV